MKLPAYPRTKPSGVEWLGDVPEHWEVKRLKMAAQLTDKKVEADDENPVPYIGMENIESWTGRLLPINPDVVPTGTANAFKAGHTLFGKLRPYLAKACNPDFDGLCSTELLVLNGVEFDRDSLRYALLSDGFIKLVDSSTYGSKMPRASWDFIGNCVLPIAPPAEQRSIAAFLDRETGRVDRLVAKKRELIERLKEKRTALISRTVTRGLPPAAARAAGLPANPPLKPSALDWLGDIPKHWEVRKFSRCAFFQEGPGLRNWQFTQDGIRVICVTNITEAGISFSNYEKFISEDEYQSTYRHFTVAKGDLLLSSSGNSWGKVATFDADDIAILNTSTIRVNENGNRTVIRSLIGWLLISEGTREQLGLFMTGSCQPNFGPSHLARVWICVPPLPEQAAIAAYLDEETAKLDALVGKVEEAVERLQEYRTALITAAVTGKIDVRKAAKLA